MTEKDRLEDRGRAERGREAREGKDEFLRPLEALGMVRVLEKGLSGRGEAKASADLQEKEEVGFGEDDRREEDGAEQAIEDEEEEASAQKLGREFCK